MSLTPPPVPTPQSSPPEKEARVPKSLLEEVRNQRDTKGATKKHPLGQAEATIYSRELAAGTHLQHYVLEKVLGSGGFGITYLAKDILLDRHVVLKENFPAHCAYRDPFTGNVTPNNQYDVDNYNWALKAFLNEARTIATLDHKGIIKILSIFEAFGTAYFATEYIDGLGLDYLGERALRTGKVYTEEELIGLLLRLLNILSYIHSKDILHKDIKPANILLSTSGIPILIDFGAARGAKVAHTSTVLSTHGFSSPEQSLGQKNLGPWSDLYSLGATFYALLHGEAPERGELRLSKDPVQPLSTDTRFNKRYSPFFLSSIDKALSPQIKDRYQSAGEWGKDLWKHLQAEPNSINISKEDIIHSPTRQALEQVAKHTIEPVQKALEVSKLNQIPLKKIFLGTATVIGCIIMALFGLDVLRSQPMGTAAKNLFTKVESVQMPRQASNPQGNTPRHEIEAPPIIEDFANEKTPELRFETDINLQPIPLSSFKLEISDHVLTAKNMPLDMPNSLRLACIQLQISQNTPAPTAAPSPTAAPVQSGKILASPRRGIKESTKLYLTIRDAEGRLIARSNNYYGEATPSPKIVFSFSFSSLPELDSHRAYTLNFETAQGKPSPVVLIACVSPPALNNNNNEAKIYPLITLVCYEGHAPDPLKYKNPKRATIISDFFTYPNSFGSTTLLNFSTEEADMPILTDLATAGYPQAQYKLSRLFAHGTAKQRNESALWLYRAAIGGYWPAQLELGRELMAPSLYLPSGSGGASLVRVRKDYSRALRFLSFATQNRSADAMFLLALMYSQGWGMPTDSGNIVNEALALTMRWNPQYHLSNLQGRANSTSPLVAPILAFWVQNSLKPNTPNTLEFRIPKNLRLTPKSYLQLTSVYGKSKVVISQYTIKSDSPHIKQDFPTTTGPFTLVAASPVSLPLNLSPAEEDYIITITVTPDSPSIGIIQLIP